MADLSQIRAACAEVIAAIDGPETPQRRSRHDVIQNAIDKLRAVLDRQTR